MTLHWRLNLQTWLRKCRAQSFWLISNIRELNARFFRSSRLEVFCKDGVLKNICRIYRKTLVLESLLNKVAGHWPASLLKRDCSTAVFFCGFAKFLRTPFSCSTSRWVLLVFQVYFHQRINLNTKFLWVLQAYLSVFFG